MTTAAPVPIEYQLIGLQEGGSVGDLLSGLDQKQGRIRLQALISEWLRMGNTKDRPSYYLFAKNSARDCIDVAPILDNPDARIQSAAPNFLS